MNVWSNLIGQNVNDRVAQVYCSLCEGADGSISTGGCILLDLDSSTRKGDYNGNYVCLQVYIGGSVVARVGRKGMIGLVAVMRCPGSSGLCYFA